MGGATGSQAGGEAGQAQAKRGGRDLVEVSAAGSTDQPKENNDSQTTLEKLGDAGALEEASVISDIFTGAISHDGAIIVGEAWDLKRGGPAHDVRSPSARRRLQLQIENSDVTWWAPECRTFSRARGKPVPGATHWPPALRSTAHPYGLPELRRERRTADREKVDTGNAIAAITFEDATRAARAGRGVAIENPANSFMWILDEAKVLEAVPGIFRVDFTNCMFAGGDRNKKTAVLTNVEEIGAALRGRTCTGREVCDRTGRRHLTWTPAVSGGIIQAYQTGGEAEYPRGLCDAVGQAIRARRAAGTPRPSRIAFTEVFAGPRAILSARVARHVVAGMGSSSSSSTSPSS